MDEQARRVSRRVLKDSRSGLAIGANIFMNVFGELHRLPGVQLVLTNIHSCVPVTSPGSRREADCAAKPAEGAQGRPQVDQQAR